MRAPTGLTFWGRREGFAEQNDSPTQAQKPLPSAPPAILAADINLYGIRRALFPPTILDVRRITHRNFPSSLLKSRRRQANRGARYTEGDAIRRLPRAGAPRRGFGIGGWQAGGPPPQHSVTPSKRLIGRRQDARFGGATGVLAAFRIVAERSRVSAVFRSATGARFGGAQR